jgi:transcriptional regulator with XRE-family HTH domain
MRIVTKPYIIAKVKQRMKRLVCNQAEYAKLVGISAGQLSHVLAGRKEPSKAILDDLGASAATYYELQE